MTEDTIFYKEFPYKKFILEVSKRYKEFRKESSNGEAEVAASIGKTVMSVRNCMKPDKQGVSDKVLTSFLKNIRVEGKVEWIGGIKKYYLGFY